MGDYLNRVSNVDLKDTKPFYIDIQYKKDSKDIVIEYNKPEKNNCEKENNTTFGNDANNIESVFPRMQRNDSKGYNNYKLCS